MAFSLGEDEEHPVIGSHVLAHHQALHPVGLSGRDFRDDTVKSGSEIDARHLRTRGRREDAKSDACGKQEAGHD